MAATTAMLTRDAYPSRRHHQSSLPEIHVPTVRRVAAAFFVNGVAATVWLAATPALAAKFGTTVGGFGVAFVRARVRRHRRDASRATIDRGFGAGRTTVIGGFAIAALLATRAAPPPAIGWFVAAQVLAGVADGVQDVAMNVVAVGVDAQTRRPIVNRLHAVWSIGAVAGGLIGATLAAADASVTAHFVVAAATVGALNLTTLGLVHLPRVAAAPVRRGPAGPLVAFAYVGGTRRDGNRGIGARRRAPDWGTLYLTMYCTRRQESRPPPPSPSRSGWSSPASPAITWCTGSAFPPYCDSAQPRLLWR